MGKNMYVDILIQSLDKKISILDEIIKADKVQRDGLEDPNLDPDDFDKTVEQKSALIEQLEQLDNGFEETFNKVKEELDQNRDNYKEEIATMQEQIRKITDRSMEIQRQEAQNRELMRQKFATVRKQVKEVRQSQKVVNQYYKNMMKRNYVDPQFMDNKK
jgi:flagellar biosynthesis/type III secretory pathway chaperone